MKESIKKSPLFKPVIYLVVILVIWGLLQILFPSTNKQENNIINNNTTDNTINNMNDIDVIDNILNEN